MAGWPVGYPSRGPWVFRDVTQDFTYWPNLDSLSITQLHPDGLSTCTVEVPDPAASLGFEDGDEHRITFRGSRVWAGHMRDADRSDMSAHGPRLWHLEGQDYTAVLGYDIIQTGHERDAESLEDRVAWILTKLTYPGITTTGVDLPNMDVEAATYEGFSVMDALEQVSDEAALHFYVDFGKDLHMFRNEIVPADIDLDDDTPNYSSTFPFSDLVHRTDRTQQTNAVFVKGKRHKRWVLDDASISAYGRIESSIIDDRLTTQAQVDAAGERRLNQLAEPIVDGRLVCWEPGMFAGRSFQIESAQWPDIDGTYIVTQAEITAPDSHDDDGEALMRTEVGYTDRRRVGRFPGSGKDKEGKDHTGGGPDSDTPEQKSPGECCNPVDIGENQLTEATGLERAFVPTDGLFTPPIRYETGDTVLLYQAVVSPPPGTFTGARIITDPVFTFQGNTTSGRRRMYRYVREIDGTEPAQWTIALSGSEPDAEGWILHVVRGPITDTTVGTKARISAANDIKADDLTLGYSDTSTLVQAMSMWESTSNEGYTSTTPGPSGYTMVGQIRVDGGGDHGEMYMSLAAGPTQATDPATFTQWDFDDPNGGTLHAIAYRVGSGYDASIDFGVNLHIIAGPTWDAGPPGVDDSADPAAASVTDGVISVTSAVYDKDFVRIMSGPPDLPTSLADWSILVPFTLTTAGDTGDPGERVLQITVVVPGEQFAMSSGVTATLEARLGDGFYAQGIRIAGTTDEYLAKDIVEGQLTYLRFTYDGVNGYGSLWTASGSEPATPDVTLPIEDWAPDTVYNEDVIVVRIVVGNDGGPAQTVAMEPLRLSGGALAGDAVDWHIVGYGDGTTVTFSTPYPYDELSLQVRVDNQQLQGSAITAMDGAAGTFTLSHAPYGDPSDPTGSSVVEARYVRG